MLSVWIQIYHQLSVPEREKLIAYIMREGVSSTLKQLGLANTASATLIKDFSD
ncbi:hypothetical protein DDI_0436 [Dickeya dianthicola RNS04.9]|nr:hypothetical protein DDI_0436 [Dickeya dianthicola RNS04.9]